MSRKVTTTREKAVVVLSGGQDSAICLALATKKFGEGNVYAISFDYGQRHSIEIKFAKNLARRFKVVQHKVVKMGFLSQLTSAALLDKKNTIETGKDQNPVVEGRNAFFLLSAAVWAKTLGATFLYTGVCEGDFQGFPDCRNVFIKAQQKTIRLALEYPITILTPMMHITKAQEWALAAKLGILDIIKNETVTCYNGIPGDGCGKCPACHLRQQGLKEFEAQNRAGK